MNVTANGRTTVVTEAELIALLERPAMRLSATVAWAIADAQDRANLNGAPVAVLERDGWFRLCEEPPDQMEPSPYDEGWQDHALVEPAEPESEPRV
jgi:hypothetical protein